MYSYIFVHGMAQQPQMAQLAFLIRTHQIFSKGAGDLVSQTRGKGVPCLHMYSVITGKVLFILFLKDLSTYPKQFAVGGQCTSIIG